MLIVKEDKTRHPDRGQIFVELTDYRDVSNIVDCNRLGYWCDKGHLRHFLLELSRVFTKEELNEILKGRI